MLTRHARSRAAVAAIASRQDDVITLEQLLAAGLGRGAIAKRVQDGWLRKMHHGVHFVGAARPSPMARARAAMLACGEQAVVSHRSAAEMWQVLPSIEGDVHVSVVGRNPPARQTSETVSAHRVAQLERAEVVPLRGLPVTSPARTICDLAGTNSSCDAERALAEALSGNS